MFFTLKTVMEINGLGCSHYKSTTLEWAAKWGVDLTPCWNCKPPFEELRELHEQMEAYAWTVPEPPRDDVLENLLQELEQMEVDSQARDYIDMDMEQSFLAFTQTQSMLM